MRLDFDETRRLTERIFEEFRVARSIREVGKLVQLGINLLIHMLVAVHVR